MFSWEDTGMRNVDWEVINKRAGVDVLDIVVNLDNRYTPYQQADLIVERCKLTAKAQAEISFKAGMKEVVEDIRDIPDGLAMIANILKDNNKSNALVIDALSNINRRWQAKLKEWEISND